MPRTSQHYRGRFAPSPTGPLHLGSLIAAVASFLDARHAGGQWLVRMEDLDPPREEPGAATDILNCLQYHGLQWDEEVLFQSSRGAAYAAALATLEAQGLLFRCDCSRAMLGSDGACRGNCRLRQREISGTCSIRISVSGDSIIQFQDTLQGRHKVVLAQSLTDFVVRRKDGLTAYQLAVVVDDAQQHITHVVRGSDLLDSTARQIFLQQQLGYTTPQYCHVPVITTVHGQKYSKQNHAPALVIEHAAANLRDALQFLQQRVPPPSLTSVEQVLAYAIEHWSVARVPATLAIPGNAINPDV
ncbi:MAG: tRNA glutamyl-Q(34) synthetase GluQRS [Halioglobus sp.]